MVMVVGDDVWMLLLLLLFLMMMMMMMIIDVDLLLYLGVGGHVRFKIGTLSKSFITTRVGANERSVTSMNANVRS